MRGSISLDRSALRATLWLVLLVAIATTIYIMKRPSADALTDIDNAGANITAADQMQLEVNTDGTITLDGLPIKETVRRTQTSDEVRVPVIVDSLDYWAKLNIVVTLPAPVLNEQYSVIPYAIHGAKAGPTTISNDRQKVTFTFEDVVSGSSVSVVLQMARGSVQLAPAAWINSQTSAFSPSLWWLVGMSIPLVVAMVLSLIAPKKNRRNKGIIPIDEPPSNLSPAAVGLLVDEKIDSHQLAATVMKLAVDGDVQIVSTTNGYRIARRRQLDHLTPTEQLVVDELRLKLKPVSQQDVIEENQQRNLFSQKITAAFTSIYQELEYRGFFSKAFTQQRNTFQFIGLFTIVFAIASSVLVMLTVTQGVNLLPVTFGIFISGWLVLTLSPHLPRLTSVGKREREQWLAFRAFLTDENKLAGGQENGRLFEEFLPYAVTFGVVGEWLNRFKAEFITIPEWYFSEESPGSAETFVAEMAAVVENVSKTLTAAALPQ